MLDTLPLVVIILTILLAIHAETMQRLLEDIGTTVTNQVEETGLLETKLYGTFLHHGIDNCLLIRPVLGSIRLLQTFQTYTGTNNIHIINSLIQLTILCQSLGIDEIHLCKTEVWPKGDTVALIIEIELVVGKTCSKLTALRLTGTITTLVPVLITVATIVTIIIHGLLYTIHYHGFIQTRVTSQLEILARIDEHRVWITSQSLVQIKWTTILPVEHLHVLSSWSITTFSIPILEEIVPCPVVSESYTGAEQHLCSTTAGITLTEGSTILTGCGSFSLYQLIITVGT